MRSVSDDLKSLPATKFIALDPFTRAVSVSVSITVKI